MYQFPIERGKIREFAIATHSDHPEYFGPRPTVPPTFLTVAGLTWEPDDDRPAVDIDQRRALHGEETYVFTGEMPRAGSLLSVRTRLDTEFTKQGKRGGQLRFVGVVREFRDEYGTLVAEQRSTAIETSHAPEQAGR